MSGTARVRTQFRAIASAALACIALCSFSILFNTQVELAFASVLFLLVTMVVAWRAGFRAASAAALCGTLCLDYFFTAPRYTIRVVSAADVASLCAFAAVALLTSHLSHQIHAQSKILVAQRERQRALYELATATLLLDWRDPIGDQICGLVLNSVGARGVALLEVTGDISVAGTVAVSTESLQASLRANQNSDVPRLSTAIRVLHSGVRPIGVICVEGEGLDTLTMDAAAPIIASAIERSRAVTAEVAAESERFSEQLRTSILDGLAHAFKTPLTTISVSSSALADISSLSEAERRDLLLLIRSESDRLARITERVLKTARLDRKSVLVLRTQPVSALTTEAIGDLAVGDRDRVHLTDLSGGAGVDVDANILKLAILQIVENALKYSPSSSPVEVTLACSDRAATISIHNQDSYIDPFEQQLIFRRFYRSPKVAHSAPGTGIGLHVAHQGVIAHGGAIKVTSSEQSGTTFHIEIPLAGDIHEEHATAG
jgi:two-component system sensor histidine kinase KdpD